MKHQRSSNDPDCARRLGEVVECDPICTETWHMKWPLIGSGSTSCNSGSKTPKIAETEDTRLESIRLRARGEGVNG